MKSAGPGAVPRGMNPWRTIVLFGLAAVLTATGTEAQPRRRRVRDAGVDAAVVRPPTHGRLDGVAAQRVLRGASERVQACYRTGLARDPLLRGEITVRLRVEEDGSVSDVQSGASEGARSGMYAVSQCIGAVLQTLRFPRPEGGPATLSAPYVLQPSE